MLAALAVAAGCAPTGPARTEAPVDAEAGEIAFEWAGTQRAGILLPVYINGTGPHSFLLDTGATLTCVDEALAAELELPEPPGQIGIGAGIGGAGRMRLVRMDSLRVGETRAESLPACAVDLGAARSIGVEFDGLLGLNFLRAFHMTLDFERNVLILTEPADEA